MNMKKRIVVSVTNDLVTDNRVNKVCEFLHQNGHQVLLIGRLKRNSAPLQSRIYQTKRMRLPFEKGPLFYATYNIWLFFYLLFKPVDALVSNDLDTLLANYLAHKIKRKSILFYDTHEFFTEVPELVNRPRTQKVWQKIEDLIFPKLNHIYTVNQSIADLYKEKYEKEISVVRNISPFPNIDAFQSKTKLGIPENKLNIIMQGAGINVHRGAEEAVLAMAFIENAQLLIVGDGDVVADLKMMVAKNGLESKVLFFPKMPYVQLLHYTHHADIGLTLDRANNINYKYSLPNKLFDYIHSQTAVIATDLIEVSRIVKKHQIGLIVPELKVELLVEAIQNLQDNPNLLMQMKDNCLKAAEEENWENERAQLKKIYAILDK